MAAPSFFPLLPVIFQNDLLWNNANDDTVVFFPVQPYNRMWKSHQNRNLFFFFMKTDVFSASQKEVYLSKALFYAEKAGRYHHGNQEKL